jgi:hypothetical protein
MRSLDQKPSNMGIAELEPRQLAPTVGTTGSGSTDSPAPSPIIDNLAASTGLGGPASAMAVDSASPLDIDSAIDAAAVIAVPAIVDTNDKIDIDSAINATAVIAVPAVVDTNDKIDIGSAIDTNAVIAVPTVVDTNDKIDIDFAIDTAVGITVPNIVSTTTPEPEVDIAGSTVIGIASPSDPGLIPAAIIVGPTSGTTEAVSAITGGFDMAFGLFNFHVDNDRVAELISVGDSTLPVMAPSTSPVTEGNPSATAPLAPLEEPRPKDSTPSVGSNDFEDPPPSPTTAYCTDCNAYTSWAPKISRLTRSPAVKTLGEALQLSTRRYPSASKLSTPSRSVPRPTTLITSKGCTQITHAQTMMTSTLRPRAK